jgi:NAD(P)-dependent dehydrogenase (short-subunit alcohol dehydrogenase family)
MLDRLGLSERVVVITGAGAGIGLATAQAFHQVGATVVITDIDDERARVAAELLSTPEERTFATTLDVSNEQEVDRVVDEVIAQFGRIDVLVNNAGLGARVPAVDLAFEQWQRVIAVGLNGCFLCSRAVGRHMIQQRSGSVVNVASIMGIVGGGLYPNAAYHASKGAVVNVTRALALEWAPYGIRVNAVAPGFVRTRLTEALLSDSAMEKSILELTPLGRLVTPEEVADSIVFLTSNLASMITGHTLPIDGGWLAR